MQKKPKPASESCTTPENLTGVTDAPCKPLREVTYVFQCTTAAKVNLAYAVAVDGQVLEAYAAGMGRVASGQTEDKKRNITRTPGSFSVKVQAGSQVALYLNSDARPGRRKNLVYAVTPQARNVIVYITEKKGRHSDSDTPVLKAPAADAKLDEYTAPLTGDIWMKVSHKFSADEVQSYMPAGTAPEVVTAVKSIYSGLKEAKLSLTLPAKGDQPARSVQVDFEDADNPKENITQFSLLSDGLPRVHPAGYAAMFNAALETGVTKLRVTSNWRPSLGSIAHREGLGLDVSRLDALRLNREELREGKGAGKDTANVSDKETELYQEYMRADGANENAKASAKAAKEAREKAAASTEAARKTLGKGAPLKSKAAAESSLAESMKAVSANEAALAATKNAAIQSKATESPSTDAAAKALAEAKAALTQAQTALKAAKPEEVQAAAQKALEAQDAATKVPGQRGMGAHAVHSGRRGQPQPLSNPPYISVRQRVRT